MGQPSILPYQLLSACLIISAILFIVPLFRPQEEPGIIPEFTYAQGYCARTTAIDLMRVVPYAGAALRNHVCSGNELVTFEQDAPPLENPAPY